MDNYRLILVVTLTFILFSLWEAWNRDYGPVAQQPPAVTQTTAQTASGAAPPAAVPAVPSTPGAVPDAPVVAGAAPVGPVAGAQPASRLIPVRTDVFDLAIDTRGGSLTDLRLNHYPKAASTPEVKFHLLRPEPPDMLVAQSGLIGGEGAAAPTHEALYTSAQEVYEMAPGQESLDVALTWEERGVRVTKTYTFHRGSYQVDVRHRIENRSGAAWTGREYHQLMRSDPVETASSQFIYTFTGGAIFSPDQKFEKFPLDKMAKEPLNRDIQGGWLAMIQHYFMTAWLPPADRLDSYYTRALPNGRYILGALTPAVSVAEGQAHEFNASFLAGPKLQDQLAAIAPGLNLTVDYGWTTVIAQPIFWLLKKIHEIVGNWGWSIILLTMMIKGAFYKLSETSYKSMANMRKLGPRMQALKDRFGDDRERLNQAMMEMYKKEKINPLGGCLPILVQIPVFIALYWVLLESVEMRQAPFILWLNDLSSKDPYYVLPVIMGISMFIQQKLNPEPPDPMQAKIMMSLPFVFTVFFAFFPSGLVLYWVVNNVLSIAQQWHITRKIEAAATHHGR